MFVVNIMFFLVVKFQLQTILLRKCIAVLTSNFLVGTHTQTQKYINLELEFRTIAEAAKYYR